MKIELSKEEIIHYIAALEYLESWCNTQHSKTKDKMVVIVKQLNELYIKLNQALEVNDE